MFKSSVRYILFFLIALSICGFFVLRKVSPNFIEGLLKPVSVVSKVVAEGELKSTDGRTNILLLGIDKRSDPHSNVGSNLTDTIMVVSLDKDGDNPVIISLPRDLWVKETQSKINAVYAFRKVYYQNREGMEPIVATDKAVSDVVSGVQSIIGIPIHYYTILGFDAFTEAIDAIGGIDVYVDESFDDYEYPIAGKENAFPVSDRYEHIHFDSGSQTMDGETALKYARSRLSTNFNEAGDFARARRQQKVIEAFKDKVLSAQTIFNPGKIADLYNSYKSNVKTNIDLNTSLLFYEAYSDVSIGDIDKIVLSNEPGNPDMPGSGTLVAPDKEERDKEYKGQYVLVPIDRTFDYIHMLVRSTLFE